MPKKEEKTNAMRILDSKKIPYRCHSYDSAFIGALEVAGALGVNPAMLFKTLVTVGKSKEYYVFVLPGDRELDLKKAARAAGEKSLEMIPQKELLPLTGYMHGGCSPIGMKKPFRTFIDRSAMEFETIFFSGGKVGYQIEMPPDDLGKVIAVTAADLAVGNSES